MSTVSPERIFVPRYCGECGHGLAERFIQSEGRARLQCESCGHIHYINPRVVTGVIVEYEGKLLLQQRAVEPRAGFWTFPGGFLEVGETAEEGAARETKEEVGLEVRLGPLLGVYSRPQVGIVLVAYTATSDTDAAFVGDAESMAVLWFAVEDVPWSELAFDSTEAALRDWVRIYTHASSSRNL
jgi:mutator protein MutT